MVSARVPCEKVKTHKERKTEKKITHKTIIAFSTLEKQESKNKKSKSINKMAHYFTPWET